MFLPRSVLVLSLGLCIVAQGPCQTSTIKCCFRLQPNPGEYNCHGTMVTLRPKEVKIQCKGALLQQSTKTTFWDLPSDVGNVTNLLLTNCSFPLNIKKILDNLKITTLVKLAVDFTEKFGNATLTADCFQELAGLKELQLSNNNFIHIEKNSFSELKDLNFIYMQLNNLQSLTDAMFQYTEKLQRLDLSKNKIENLPENIFQNLTNLTYLYIRENKLQDINDRTFRNLKNLEVLDLSFNNITRFAKNSFDGLKSLKKIFLNQNQFTEFPNNIFKENLNLQLADINSNKLLTALPDYLFANLPNLKEVKLEDCNLMILPENLFEGCENLQYISLKRNAIKSLPENIFADIGNLQVLNLSCNKLSELSDQLFRSLTKLKVLNLNHNSLVKLEKDVFNKLDSLEEINLENNRLKRFDSELFFKTDRLKKIILSNNQIEVPEFDSGIAFNTLQRLEELDLGNNSITRFNRDWTKFLIKLKKLDLSLNNISCISFEDIFAGSRNVAIDLSHNNISRVDFSMAERLTKNRQKLNYNIVVKLNNNPLDCNCHLYDLIRYFDGSMNSLVKKYVQIQADNLHCKAPSNMINSSVKKLELRKLKCAFGQLELESCSNVCDCDQLELEPCSNVCDCDQLELEPCSNVCDCDFRPWDRALLIDCENRNLTEIPKFTLPSTNFYNQTHVNLEHNYLKSGPISDIGYENVTQLLLSFNNISQLTWIPPNLKILSLDNNNISQIDVDTLTMVNSSQLINISLGGNPYICDCSTVNFYKFLVSPFWNKKIDINQIKCENDGNLLVHLTTDDLCPTSQVPIYFAYAILAVILLMICVFLLLSHRYKIKIIMYIDKHTPAWFPKLQYDAFICYSHKDETFVLEEIISVLEGDPKPYKLCIHIRDWIPGKIITDQIITSIDSSRKTLIILSPNFLESVWGLVEFKMAHFQAMKQRSEKVVVVLYGDVDVNADLDDVLKVYVRTNTYVKWGDAYFWKKLRRALEEPNAKNEISLSQKDQNIAITLKDNVAAKLKSSTETIPTLITVDPLLPNKVETHSVCLESS